jgi:hypothetical protein
MLCRDTIASYCENHTKTRIHRVQQHALYREQLCLAVRIEEAGHLPAPHVPPLLTDRIVSQAEAKRPRQQVSRLYLDMRVLWDSYLFLVTSEKGVLLGFPHLQVHKPFIIPCKVITV